jgi:hypothetical protein
MYDTNDPETDDRENQIDPEMCGKPFQQPNGERGKQEAKNNEQNLTAGRIRYHEQTPAKITI